MSNSKVIYVLGEDEADVPTIVRALKLGFNVLKMHDYAAHVVHVDNPTKSFYAKVGDVRIDVVVAREVG